MRGPNKTPSPSPVAEPARSDSARPDHNSLPSDATVDRQKECLAQSSPSAPTSIPAGHRLQPLGIPRGRGSETAADAWRASSQTPDKGDATSIPPSCLVRPAQPHRLSPQEIGDRGQSALNSDKLK